MHQEPTRVSASLFLAKVRVLQLQRAAKDLAQPVRKHIRDEGLTALHLLGESVTPLWSDSDPAERMNQCGKVQNLRVALRTINRVVIPAGETFSFWKQLGQATKANGYAPGRELREGCLIPTIGGGLCQLSNALYEAALQAGFDIVERHGHSETIPGSAAARGRDATVFWNYVDLRFRSEHAFRIEAKLTRDQLVLRIWSSEPKRYLAVVQPGLAASVSEEHHPNSCMSCGVVSCFGFQEAQKEPPSAGRTAFVVDDVWPEFDEYVRSKKAENDLILLPLDGKRFGKPNYAWSTQLFKTVKTFPLFALRRAIVSRRLAAQGATRQRELFHQHQILATQLYARAIPFDVTHVVVSQVLLPYLWASGALGGRTFDVLMTGLPAHEVQRRLDVGLALHPESTTLGDFRAPADIIESEREALAAARKIITPHSQVAKCFQPEKVEKLAWQLPSVTVAHNVPATRIVFPASTLGRKGAYELRAAAAELGLPITVVGADLESSEFWKEVQIHRALPSPADWLADAAVVVLPSFIEHQPRRLLQAIAHGVPVIASDACGLEGVPGVTIVESGNVPALAEAVSRILKSVVEVHDQPNAAGVGVSGSIRQP